MDKWNNFFSLFLLSLSPAIRPTARRSGQKKAHHDSPTAQAGHLLRGSLPLQHPALLWRALLQRRRDGSHIGLRANPTLAQSEACLISMPTNISRMSQSMKKSILDLVSGTPALECSPLAHLPRLDPSWHPSREREEKVEISSTVKEIPGSTMA
ncbi:uncharacterized protein [Callorhinus ursinus]